MASKGKGNGNKNQKDAGGRPGVMIDPAVQNAVRRAVKARQRANSGSNKGLHAETYWAGLQSDRGASRRRAQERREAAAASGAREDRAAKLKEQARVALDFEALLALESGTPAAELALLALELYPTVQVHRVGGVSQGRVEAAITAASLELRKQHKDREGAINLGARVVRRALRWAGHKVFDDSPQEVAVV